MPGKEHMSEADTGGSDNDAVRAENRNAAVLGTADWLCLAAAPTFAFMALLTAVLAGGSADMLCPAAHASALGGMVPMYLLMSAFHSAPWLKLISNRRRGAPTRSMPAKHSWLNNAL